MKLFVVLVCALVGVVLAGNTDIDWSTVRPIYEYKSWQDAHPSHMRLFMQHNAMPMFAQMKFGPNGRIVGGGEAERHQFPYQVGLVLHLSNGNGWCGGSLVSKNYVMTAAHCVDDGVTSLIAVLGAHNVFIQTEPTQQRIFVGQENFKIYPNWDATLIRNDIAVFRLPEEANYGEFIRSVRLPNRRLVDQTFAGQEAMVSGWGRFSDSIPELATELRYVRLQIITALSCRTRFPTIITDQHICADGGVGGPCSGDSGGPLSIIAADNRTTQVGIVSFGLGLGCELNWPSVYVRVTSFLDWIEENTDGTIAENWE